MEEFYEVLTREQILLRLITFILIGRVIGYEREYNKQPAGFRTHILVCLGATLVSLIQDQLRINLLNLVIKNPLTAQVLKTDLGRIGAQVVSGIGFLGAGTIMREKKSVAGLTTAASIWATGCIGLGIGWGFYNLTIPAAIFVLIVLVTLKQFERKFIENKIEHKITIFYTETKNLSMSIVETYQLFKNYNIKIRSLKKDLKTSKVLYYLVMPKNISFSDVALELTGLESITEIREQ